MAETPRTIPKFDGALPTSSTYNTWLKAATTYFGGNTANVNKGRIDGLVCLAFKDAALEWYVEETEQDNTFPASWEAFSQAFTKRFGPKTLAQADIAALLSSTKMASDEHIQRFRTRCLTAARHSVFKIPEPEDEGNAAKTLRLETQKQIIHTQAKWFFLQGVLPVIRDELLQCKFTDFDTCVRSAEDTITLLVDRGKYRDPARPNPPQPGPRDPTSKHKNVEMLNTTIASLEAQLAQFKTGNVSAASSRGRGQGRGRGNGRGGGQKRDPTKYTPNAVCTYCSKSNHTEEQCFAKKNAAKQAGTVNAIDSTKNCDSLPSSQGFWEGAGM